MGRVLFFLAQTANPYDPAQRRGRISPAAKKSSAVSSAPCPKSDSTVTAQLTTYACGMTGPHPSAAIISGSCEP